MKKLNEIDEDLSSLGRPIEVRDVQLELEENKAQAKLYESIDMDNGPSVKQLISHWNDKCKPQKIEEEWKKVIFVKIAIR